MKRLFTVVLAFALVVSCFAGSGLTAQAAQPAGYHEYTTTEEEAVDTWYAVSRWVYLSYGRSKVMQAGKAKVSISGATNATQIVDDLRLGLYLDESSNNVSYGTIGVYHFSSTNDTSVSGGQANVNAISDYYYRARGVHMVTEGSVTETTDTSTDAIIAL